MECLNIFNKSIKIPKEKEKFQLNWMLSIIVLKVIV